MQKGEADNFYPHLIASALGVDGATVATTNLTFEPGIDLSNHVPIHAIIRFASGVLGICNVSVTANGVAITGATLLLDVTAATPNLVLDLSISGKPITNDPTKFIKIKVDTASLAASTFDIFVYGTQFN